MALLVANLYEMSVDLKITTYHYHFIDSVGAKLIFLHGHGI